MPVTLGYWNLRGLAQPVRLLLHYVGEAYNENRIEFTEDKRNWNSLKGELGLDFPNLPYLIDGDCKITQSVAIMRYLAEKHGLTGKDAHENAVIGMVEQQIYDLQFGLIRVAYDSNFEETVKSYLQSLPEKLGLFEKFMEGKKFILGDRLTYVDFNLFETLEHHEFLKGSCLRDCPNLREFLRRMRDLPGMKEYLNSGKCLKWPIYSSLASFGGKGSYPMFE